MLLPTARVANVEKSFAAYIDQNLGTVFTPESFSGIDYPGRPLNIEQLGLVDWIEPRVVGPARAGVGSSLGREISPGVRAQEAVYIFQVSCYCRPSKATSAYRLTEMRDIVVGCLHESVRLPIYDYGDDRMFLGVMALGEVSMDQAVPTPEAESDLIQWTYSINARWVEEYRRE